MTTWHAITPPTYPPLLPAICSPKDVSRLMILQLILSRILFESRVYDKELSTMISDGQMVLFGIVTSSFNEQEQLSVV